MKTVLVRQSNFYMNMKKEFPRLKAVSRCQVHFKGLAVFLLVPETGTIFMVLSLQRLAVFSWCYHFKDWQYFHGIITSKTGGIFMVLSLQRLAVFSWYYHFNDWQYFHGIITSKTSSIFMVLSLQRLAVFSWYYHFKDSVRTNSRCKGHFKESGSILASTITLDSDSVLVGTITSKTPAVFGKKEKANPHISRTC
jgi:hypothetical protein